tara:strand:- start:258 stop:1313 length:1056 start_codon:yes stop_codon:yes gene_type:complete
MIHKYLLIGNEIVKRNKIKLIDKKDIVLFEKDRKKRITDSYYFKFYNKILNSNGPMMSFEIIFDYLGFKSLSKNILFKKILLLLLFLFNQTKVIFKNKKILNYELFIIHNRNSIGYFHWMLDILPKLIFIKNKFKNKKIIICLPENLKKKFVLKSLSILKIKYKILLNDYNYLLRRGYYISEIYPSGNPRPKLIIDLKKKFSTFFSKKKKKLIYISRNHSNRRKLTNDTKFQKYLKRYGFTTYHMEKKSLEEQIEICSSAKIIIGFYGAGLVNSIWMKKNTHLIELRPEKDKFANCFYSIASINRVNYNYFVCKKINKFKSTTFADYKVDIKTFDKKFKKKLNNIINGIKN